MLDRRAHMRKIKVILMSVLLALFIAGCSSGTSAEFFESGSQISGKTEQSDSGMEVHFIDVGQGDATLIKAGDHAMLIDAGDNSEGTAVQSYLNSQGIEKLDYVIGTHPDADHIGGLDVVVYKFDCKKIFMPGVTSDTKTYDDVMQALKSKNQKAQAPKPGETYTLGDASFTVIAPVKGYGDETNNWSIGMVRQYGENRFLFTGHEIGSHSNKHLWVNKMTRQEFAEDTRIAIGEIENLIGRKVKSFRAPAFSIGKNNDWAFDVLAENGIEYDCSIFPANRDLGGFPHFTSSIPALIKKGVYTIKEFPICPVTLMGKSVTFSGGGYFRLVPLWLQKNFIERMDYVMFYFHINDLIEQNSKFMTKAEFEEYFKEVGTLKNRIIRYAKANIGKGGALNKLEVLLQTYVFCNVGQAAKEINWSKQPLIEL